ncbi:methyl-accepting chemotaxis protein [Mangrovibrevibacter kandeliae]|uniref:methyl-accepting chemotaxis protein n=1 Tax=Mangrovibrevibacter kandeliae TaxID=2968473 RepID=UPI002118439C|nr:PAS domain-containing methyl-accepting chemotaxis protein [Aurantimonas sp. CSK15Z-1]MCQ8781463.1 PAS domain-containing methyl-accepting chemotaxis protein [Aurantimonas sp. CSK15Z-1]
MALFRSDAANVLGAISKSLAVIEFDPTGKILTANENFLTTMGYQLAEIQGRHHSMFAAPDYANSNEYKQFWQTLARGESESGVFWRYGKGGRVVVIRASYNPVRDGGGKVYKVVKVASDITETKLGELETAAWRDALSRVQAIIEFTPSGEILNANENFLTTMGYRLEEIRGKHHRMFVEPAFANSADYEQFWAKLRSGQYVADQFKRVGKGGKEVHIQASYNPIKDQDGKVFKVVKFATDITLRIASVRALGAGLRELAQGDLEQQLQMEFSPNFLSLKTDFNESIEHLREAMREVGAHAATIKGGADQIRRAADDLAGRTEQQASALEETSATLSELTDTVKQSSKRAEEAGQLVGRTKADAERSGVSVSRAVEAMAHIEKSSEAIGKIIGVIDEIAFQTNLLALNAGVEAARAGEAGRGFAVVAQEVRGLAQRSAEAAKEIKDLISTSHHQVQSGVELVGEAGKSLQAIVTGVLEIDGLVASIVETARSQAIGLNEINVAIGTLNNATQQNAAMVEETTAAGNELATEAGDLNKLLAKFRTGAANIRHSGGYGSHARAA